VIDISPPLWLIRTAQCWRSKAVDHSWVSVHVSV